MELNQLVYFQKVARLGNLTKAAQELYLAQPTLSQSLSRLEDSLGTPLFERNRGKRIQLNEAGLLFLERVDRILEEVDQAVNDVRKASSETSTHVSIASSVQDLCQDLLAEEFIRKPGITISEWMMNTASLTEELLNDRVDFALSPCPLPDPRLESVPLSTEELLVVVGPQHRLFGRTSASREELVDECFACNYAESDRVALENMFREIGKTPNIVLESNEPNSIRRMVEGGHVIALRPARLIFRRQRLNYDDKSRALRVSDYKLSLTTCITRKKSRILSDVSQDFYEFAQQYCHDEIERTAELLEEHYPLN